MELFSFEQMENSPVPIRFGKGGVNEKAIRNNPKAEFIPGYRGIALDRLANVDIAPNNGNPFFPRTMVRRKQFRDRL